MGIRIFSHRLIKLSKYLLLVSGLLLLFQNCTPAGFINFTQSPGSGQISSSVGGEVYDGKLTYIEVEPEFKCENLAAPKSILRRDKKGDWTLTVNDISKCALTSEVVTDMEFKDPYLPAFLKYRNLNYNLDQNAPDTPVSLAGYLKNYFVDPMADPNTSDNNLGDGLCADSFGNCSLKAAIEEANSPPLIGSIVHIPAGVYTLSSRLIVGSSAFIGIYGEDPTTTIIENGGTNGLIAIGELPGSPQGPVHLENINFRKGRSNVAYSAGGIFVNATLNIKNCILDSFQAGITPVIYGGPGSGHILIENTRIRNNATTAIEIFGAKSLTVLNSELINNAGYGINVSNGSWNIQILNTTIATNGQGVRLRKCFSNCKIENSTISGNNSYGLIVTSAPDNSLDDLIIRNSTITNNALTTGSNIKLDCPLTKAQNINFFNSIVSIGSSLRPNCEITASNTSAIVASHSVVDDESCAGTGFTIADPQLFPLAKNGGFNSTHSFFMTSPLLDGGDNSTCPSIDQRGLPRPIDKLGAGSRCDIGAVEAQ
jgi:hypothetical protein